MNPEPDHVARIHASADARDAVGEMLDAVVQLEAVMSSLAAVRFELVDRARQLSTLADGAVGTAEAGMSRRVFRAELACALRIPERTADRLATDAEKLVNTLRASLAELRAGRLSERHARILVDQLGDLSGDEQIEIEREALALAPTLTAAKFERRVRSLRERRVPGEQVARHERAREQRDVVIHPERDGMAWLGALLPAVEAVAIHSRLDRAARSLRRGGDSRTLPQLRAELFCSVLLDDDEAADRPGVERTRFRAIRPQVIVTVPAMNLVGDDSSPGELEGYGPIDAATARRLVGDCSTLQRLLTDPVTGAQLVLDRTRYRVTEDLRMWLRVRDGGCRFPGCGRRASGCDIDHTQDWALHGQTAQSNLAHLCRAHHVLKHASAWSVRQQPDHPGDLEWTSPLGRQYVTKPAFERVPAEPAWRGAPRFELEPAAPP